ncbi:LppU/SCO3897 family protein [Fodinicola feengrottensis]|uniref:LppU/SCO3897 family protein n=1 Tax=Fodinicola feengrottensis TaxID=435914 RepID=UPI0013D74DD2|nr:hypothetical protein [Fodinicola feengrottensis]
MAAASSVVVVIGVLVLGCLGGASYGAYYLYTLANKATSAASSNSRPAAANSPRNNRTGDGDEDHLKVGQCVTTRDEGSDSYLDLAPGCGSGTYKLVSRYDGTTAKSLCDDDTDYTYTNEGTPPYVLCLKSN